MPSTIASPPAAASLGRCDRDDGLSCLSQFHQTAVRPSATDAGDRRQPLADDDLSRLSVLAPTGAGFRYSPAGGNLKPMYVWNNAWSDTKAMVPHDHGRSWAAPPTMCRTTCGQS